MNGTLRNFRSSRRDSTASAAAACVGRIVQILPSGQAVVEIPGQPARSLPSRSAVDLSAWTGGPSSLVDAPVLLVFENGDPGKPVIAGIVRDELSPRALAVLPAGSSTGAAQAMMDGKRVVLEAEQEIVLQCGRGSITLTADGKIVIKGTELVSRASRSNRIKGATVNIN